jgi:relaxase-like protein
VIGKITTGKSFKGCILYCLNDKKQQPGKEQVMQGRAEIIMFNQCFGNQKELIEQFNAVRQLNPKLSKPVLHITLSLAASDQVTKDKVMEMCEDLAREMGFEKNQYIAVQHLDTNHRHLHIVANRIGFDKRTVSDSNNYKKIAAYCRKMELKYKLRQVLSPRQFLSSEQKLIPRHDTRKAQIKEHIRQSLAASRNYHEFERLMKEKKYQVIKARGIAFIDEKKVYVKGSDLSYSLQTIERILEQNKLTLNSQNIVHQQQSINKSFTNVQSSGKTNDLSNSYLQKELSKVIDNLIKPEENKVQLPYELTHTKKKKKGLRPN